MRTETNNSNKQDTMVLKMEDQGIENPLARQSTKKIAGEDYLDLGQHKFARGEE